MQTLAALVLCTLQQSLLMKYLPLDLIPDFIFEVKERAAIVEDGADSTNTPFEIFAPHPTALIFRGVYVVVESRKKRFIRTFDTAGEFVMTSSVA